MEKNKPSFKNNKELLIYLFLRIKQTGKWWLIPLLMLLAVFSLFISLTGNQSILPAIYVIF